MMRFTAVVNYLDISADQEAIAAGASDFVIKIVHLHQEGEYKTVSLNGHEAPILCVKFDPAGKYLVGEHLGGTGV